MKILFLTPTGGRTGSEMMLWYLLQNLHNTNINPILFARKKGELFDDLNIKVAYFGSSKQSFIRSIYEGLYYKLFGQTTEESLIEKLHKKHKPELWYLNTLMMPQFARLANKLNVPYVVHAHELPQTFDDLKYEEFELMLANAKKIIACSTIVKARFEQMGLQNVTLMHSFIDHSKIKITQKPDTLRQALNIPDDAFVWVMSGTLSLRKGYDLVPDLLEKLPQSAYIIWLGQGRDSGIRYYVEQRVKHKNLNFVMLGAKTDDYYDYLNMADGFVLLAREDPFPLVMMEAAYLQKPIVGFESGGIVEFLEDGMGAIVEGFNVSQLAQKMNDIMSGEIKIDANKLKNRSFTFGLNQMELWTKEIVN